MEVLIRRCKAALARASGWCRFTFSTVDSFLLEDWIKSERVFRRSDVARWRAFTVQTSMEARVEAKQNARVIRS